MKEMNAEELATFHDKLADLVAAGKEEEADEYLSHHLARLPEDLKNEILGRAFFQSLVDEAQEIEAIADIQKQGLAAVEALEAVKEAIRKGANK